MTTQEAFTALTTGFAKANLNADAIQEKLMQIRGFVAAGKAFGNFSIEQMAELLPMLEAHYAPAPAPTFAELSAAQRPAPVAKPRRTEGSEYTLHPSRRQDAMLMAAKIAFDGEESTVHCGNTNFIGSPHTQQVTEYGSDSQFVQNHYWFAEFQDGWKFIGMDSNA